MSTDETRAEAWQRLRDHFKDWNDRIMFGVEGAENMGLITESPPCRFTADLSIYPVSTDPDIAKLVEVAHRGGVPEPYTIFGVDLARDRDRSVDVAVEVINGERIFIVLDPFGAEILKRMDQPIKPKPAKEHRRPWVDMKRKPWERKR